MVSSGSKTSSLRGFHLRVFACVLLAMAILPAHALVVNIIEGQTNGTTPAYQRWETVASSMGHTTDILPATFLDLPANLAVTDILILSIGTDDAMYDPTRVANIIQYLQSGGKVYLQSEYDNMFAGNITFQTIVNTLGSTFTWAATPTSDYISPLVTTGSMATTDQVVPPITMSFWWGRTANCVNDVEGFLEFNNNHYGFIYCVPNSSGRIITMSDQDLIQNFFDPAVQALMENIMTNLSSDAYQCQLNVGTPVDLGPDVSLCSNDPITLGPVANSNSILWSDGSTGTALTVQTPGTYWVTVGEPGCTGSDTIVVGSGDLPVVDLGPDLSTCVGSVEIVPVQAEGGTSVWSTGETTGTITVTDPGEYTLEITNDCGTATDQIIVDLGGSAPVDLGPDTVVCSGGSITLGPMPSTATVGWSDGSTGSELSVEEAGIYWVTIEENGCIGSDTVQVEIEQIPQVQLEEDLLTCASLVEIVPIQAEGGTLFWSTGASTPSITVETSATYSLQISNACGEASDEIIIELGQIPLPDLGPDTSICAGASFQVEVALAGPIVWSDGSTNSEIQISDAGTFWVTTGSGDCLASDTIIVNMIETPAVQLGLDSTSCNGTPIQVIPSVATGSIFSWSTGESAETITATVSGIYELTVENECGQASDEIVIEIVPPIDPDLGPDTTICSGTSITLSTGVPEGSFLWSDSSTGDELFVDQPGTYSVDVTISGCTESDEVMVEMVDPPALQIPQGPIVICDESPVTLIAEISTGTSVEWSTGNIGTELITDQPGSYIATGSTACASISDTIEVVQAPAFPYPEDRTICSASTAVVSLEDVATTISWNEGSTDLVRDLPEGTYSFNAIDLFGCERNGNFSILIDPQADGLNFIPNSFTPNGDGINDIFLLSSAEAEHYRLEIFDRWGEKIYDGSDPTEGWDGQMNGQNVPNGLYVYQLETRSVCADTGLQKIRGHVSVVR